MPPCSIATKLRKGVGGRTPSRRRSRIQAGWCTPTRPACPKARDRRRDGHDFWSHRQVLCIAGAVSSRARDSGVLRSSSDTLDVC
jgi:hypothetical protein